MLDSELVPGMAGAVRLSIGRELAMTIQHPYPFDGLWLWLQAGPTGAW